MVMETVLLEIAKFVLNKMVEGGAGKLGENLAVGTVAKVKKLGEMVLNRIKGNPGVESAVPRLAQGDSEAIAVIQG
jgi:hypothetical protein